jgi:hypothetical protein
MTDRELITGLDACRPARDDLRQSELRAVADQVASDDRAQSIRVRMERIDQAVLRTIQDMPLPEGFVGRQIARLREAAREAAIGDAAGSELLPAPLVPASPGAGSARSRRRIAWSAGLLATAVAVLVAVVFLRRDTPLVREDLELSRQWHDQLATDSGWLPIEPEEFEQHSLPNELRQFPRRYRDASSIVGREARAYDLTLPGGPPATLFVIPQSARAGLPSSPPTSPQSSTLGLRVAYWQTGGFIYVVVLQSDRGEDYQNLLRPVASVAA